MNYNDIFEYVNGELFWRPQNERGFMRSGCRAGTLNKGYLWVRSNKIGQTMSVHRIIWEMHNGPVPDGMVVDHIDRNKLNNRIENLRLATRSENSMNASGKSGRSRSDLPKNVSVDYVYRDKIKYRAQVCRTGEVVRRGPFETVDEAKEAAEELRKTLHGDFFCSLSPL